MKSNKIESEESKQAFLNWYNTLSAWSKEEIRQEAEDCGALKYNEDTSEENTEIE